MLGLRLAEKGLVPLLAFEASFTCTSRACPSTGAYGMHHLHLLVELSKQNKAHTSSKKHSTVQHSTV